MSAVGTSALSVEARPEKLATVRDFLEDACRRAGVAQRDTFDLLIALDEVGTNIVTHGYAGMAPGPLRVELAVGGGRATLTISDRGRAFDPADAPEPDLSSDLEHRQLGGLGWYLVRHLMDEVRYTREADGNRLTLVKILRGSEDAA